MQKRQEMQKCMKYFTFLQAPVIFQHGIRDWQNVKILMQCIIWATATLMVGAWNKIMQKRLSGIEKLRKLERLVR